MIDSGQQKIPEKQPAGTVRDPRAPAGCAVRVPCGPPEVLMRPSLQRPPGSLDSVRHVHTRAHSEAYCSVMKLNSISVG